MTLLDTPAPPARATAPPADAGTVTAGLLRDLLEDRGGMDTLADRLGRPGGGWFLTVLTDAVPIPTRARAAPSLQLRPAMRAQRPTPPLSPGSVAALAGLLRSGATATPLDGDVVVLAPYTGAGDAVRLAERMRARFSARLGRELVGCVSEPFAAPAVGTSTDAAVLCRNLRRAISLLDGAPAQGSAAPAPAQDSAVPAATAAAATTVPAPKVLTSAQLRPQLMLAELTELAGERASLNGGPLEILRRHDAARGSDFLGSLLAYFDAGRDVTEAAKRIHVHRNTLRYRLRRVEELSAVSLADPLERFTLELQVRLHFVSPTI